MKKHILNILLILAATGGGPAFGQSSISEISGLASDSSIIRYWKADKSVIYTSNGSGNNYFLLADQSTGMVRRITVPANVTVNDFRILHDTVFAGGYFNNAGTKQGLLACFNINDFNNSGGNYHWAVAQQSAMPDCYDGCCQNQIDEITRIALYDTSNNDSTEIAFIAKNHIVGETTMRVGIGHARFNGTTWNRMFIYNKYAVEEYTDIIATSQYVAAVGKSNDSARLVMRIFPKHDFIVPTCPLPNYCYYYNMYGQGMKDLTVCTDVMATALDNDDFAVAYHFYGPYTKGLALKTFSISSSLASLTQAINIESTKTPSPMWKMRDIRYSPLMRRIAVLNDYNGGGMASNVSVIYQFHATPLTAGTYHGHYLSGHKLFSMDCNTANPHSYICSGIGSGDTRFFDEFFSTSASCGTTDAVKAELTSDAIYATFMQTNTNEPLFNWGTTAFVTDIINRDIICAK